MALNIDFSRQKEPDAGTKPAAPMEFFEKKTPPAAEPVEKGDTPPTTPAPMEFFAKKPPTAEPVEPPAPSEPAAEREPVDFTMPADNAPPPTVPPVGGSSMFGRKKSGGVVDGEVDVIYLSPNGKSWAGYPWVSLTFVEWNESTGDTDDEITFIFGKQTVCIKGKRLSRLAEIIQTRKVARVSPSLPGGEFKKEEWIRSVEIIEADDDEDEDGA